MTNFTFDIQNTPFSRRESNWAVSLLESSDARPGCLCLRWIHGGSSKPIWRIEAIVDAKVVDPEIIASPEALMLRHNKGFAEIILSTSNAIRLRCSGLALRLTATTGPEQWGLMIPAGVDRWRAILLGVKQSFAQIEGEMTVISPWKPNRTQGHCHHSCNPIQVSMSDECEILIQQYESETEPPQATMSFAAERQSAADDFAAWRDACPPAPERYAAARELGAYIGWSCVIPPDGLLFTPVMLMSKVGMVNTWNWDNYFNAWASTYRDPEFAWNQYLLYIRHQHPTGALGDAINQNRIGWAYTKPPVHGWILRRMMQINPAIGTGRLLEVYESLCRWTEWWFRYRDDDGDGICQYHHGNDSGWDDASAFDVGSPTETPDLSALLILQMDALGQFADQLGKTREATRWQQRSADLLASFFEHSWRDGEFVTLMSGTHTSETAGDSLLHFIPLILGHRLPQEIRKKLISGLIRPGRFLTEWGLASEAVDSPEFVRRGYWRGAIWPPPMLMIIDGLADAGEHELARDLAERFCRMVSIHGFGENHDALSGEIHYDTAYTWSVSIFQILAAQYLSTATRK